MTFQETWGSRLRAIRKAKGLTLNQLSRLADVDQSHLSKIERGVLGTSDDTRLRIAKALDVDPNDLWAYPAEVAP